MIFKVSFLLGVLAACVSAQGDSLFIRKVTSNTGQRHISAVCDRNDAVAERVLGEYGAVFLTAATPPSKCVFRNEAEVNAFQGKVEFSTVNLSGISITLQKKAMSALLDAISGAKEKGLKISPRGKSIAGTRNYADTSRLWLSRFNPAINYWQKRGRITKADADMARDLTPFEQVPIVLAWEADEMFFSTGFSRTILSSVAAPGTSQHLSGLAFDAMEFSNGRVRAILNDHGWFQTVASDEPHFTYIGADEGELPKLGLKTVVRGSYKYWVPEL